ncbi:uncharacterized protein [Triticum aestivum]|nr:uncharacterized protein LOC123083462 [Triticum aestivum]
MVAMPKTTIFFSTIIFMLLFAQASGSDSGKPKVTKLMVEACKKASINNPYNESLTQEFCLSTLQSDNRSAKAKDLHDLVLVTVDILKSRVAAASGKIKQKLQDAKKGTVAMHVLSYCEVEYEDVVRRLNVCHSLIKDYQGDKSGQQFLHLPDCVDMNYGPIVMCWYELPDMPGAEALIKENDELIMLVILNNALLILYDVRD